MIAFRTILLATLVLLVGVVGSVLWQMHSPDAGPLDVLAVRRIRRMCGFEAECKVKIGDLFDGKWDTFYEFGSHVSQQDVNAVLGTRQLLMEDHQRMILMMRGGAVLTRRYEPDGVGRPLDGEIEFEDEWHRDERGVRYDRETWLQVHRFPIDSSDEGRGSYYVLRALPKS